MLMTRTGVCLAFLFALASSTFAQEPPPAFGKAVVVYNLRAARAPLGQHLEASGWAVEHWILSPPGKELAEPKRINRLVIQYSGRLILTASFTAPDSPEAAWQVRLEAYDGSGKQVATATGSAASQLPDLQEATDAAIAAALADAVPGLVETIQDRIDEVVVKRRFHLIIQLMNRKQYRKFAEPLYDAVAGLVAKENKGFGAFKTLVSGPMLFRGILEYAGTADELAAVIDAAIASDPHLRPMQQVSVLGDELRYLFNERPIMVRITNMKKATYDLVRESIIMTLTKLPKITRATEAYSSENATLNLQVYYMGEAWVLDRDGFPALRMIEPLSGLELIDRTAYRLRYRLAGDERGCTIRLLQINEALREEQAVSFVEQLNHIPGLKVVGKPKYEPLHPDKRWSFRCLTTGRLEEVDQNLSAYFQTHLAWAPLVRMPGDESDELRYIYAPKPPQRTAFTIAIRHVGRQEIRGVCDLLREQLIRKSRAAGSVLKTLKLRNLSPKSNEADNEYLLSGSVEGTLAQFNAALWNELLRVDKRFSVFTGLKNERNTLALAYTQTPPSVMDVSLLVKGMSDIQYERYGKRLFESITAMPGASDFSEPIFLKYAAAGRLEGRFAGDGMAFSDAVERARTTVAEGRFFVQTGVVGNSIAYRFVSAGELILRVKNLPKERMKEVAARVEQIVNAQAGVTASVLTLNNEARQLVVAVTTERATPDFLGSVADAFARSDELANTVVGESHSNLIGVSFVDSDKASTLQSVSKMASLLETAASVRQSVVQIRTQHRGKLWYGVGTLVSPRGDILTTRSAVEPQRHTPEAAIVSVQVNGRWYRASFVAVSAVQNLALITIPGEWFPYVKMGEEVSGAIGQPVFAVGDLVSDGWRPEGLSIGRVTALNQHWSNGPQTPSWEFPSGVVVSNVSEHSLVAYRRATGAPVFNPAGKMIGLIVGGGESSEYKDARNFIPVQKMKPLLERIGR